MFVCVNAFYLRKSGANRHVCITVFYLAVLISKISGTFDLIRLVFENDEDRG